MDSSPALLTPERINVEDWASPHSDHIADTGDNSLLSPSEASHDYNCSGIYEDSTEPSGQEETTDDEIARQNGSTSSRSSISSLPASVAASAFNHPMDAITPTKNTLNAQDISNSPRSQARSPGRFNERSYGSPFRHASSVRAMQMRDEDAFSVVHHRRDSQMTGRMSHHSGRSSSTSSPTKRRTKDSPQKSKLKKEYPLVLLHCTLLPPTLNIPPLHPGLLQEILPEPYWQRWRLLNDKISANSEVKTRGVLIPHPRGDYDVLEERLLESLELVKPRIRSGHYMGVEDDEQFDEIDDETSTHGPPCPDCGRKIPDLDEDQKWEVKVYAANGLMRAGAWSAAWSDMEKIDVEVGVHLPADVRGMIEASLHEISESSEVEEHPQEGHQMNEREREVYGAGGKQTQDEIDGLADSTPAAADPVAEHWTRPDPVSSPVMQPALGDLLRAYVHKLLDDKKNTVIMFLSVLIIWVAFTTGQAPLQEKPISDITAPISVPETVISTSYITTTALETSVVVLRPSVVVDTSSTYQTTVARETPVVIPQPSVISDISGSYNAEEALETTSVNPQPSIAPQQSYMEERPAIAERSITEDEPEVAQHALPTE